LRRHAAGVIVTDPVIDDFSQPEPRARIGASWELVADTVMGGCSAGRARRETVQGRPAIRMTGTVRLENNGGFLQIALNLSPDGSAVDASSWDGIALDVLGDGESYGLHLRTADIRKPWQSYRHSFTAPMNSWTTVALPFEAFAPHRIEAPLDRKRLRRIGIVAIGRAFDPDLAVAGIRFYRDTQ
jgi:hypothetical protein